MEAQAWFPALAFLSGACWGAPCSPTGMLALAGVASWGGVGALQALPDRKRQL